MRNSKIKHLSKRRLKILIKKEIEKDVLNLLSSGNRVNNDTNTKSFVSKVINNTINKFNKDSEW